MIAYKRKQKKKKNLRKWKTLNQFFLVAVGKEPVDPQDTRLNRMRHFVQAHFQNFRTQTTISVDTIWLCSSEETHKQTY